MKKTNVMTVKSVQEIALETIEMELVNAYVAEMALPGQFLHFQVAGHILRRPLSIADVDRGNNCITILFKRIGKGTEGLATYKPGMTIDALGPSGNGFPYALPMKTALLIGGGIGIPPLYNLGKSLQEKGIHVISVLGFQSRDSVFYEEKFSNLGTSYVVTDDGSYGYHGFVTSMLDKVNDFDYYYSCGPVPMLQAVTKSLQGKNGFISLEERMGCGVGACLACVISTGDDGGYRKICKDGPVFAVDEVVL